MSKNYKAYVDESKLYKNGRANNDYKWKESEDGLYKFLNDNDGYKYVFYCEPRESGKDCETSYLSANIFLKLIEKYYRTIGKAIFIDEQATHKQYYFTKAGEKNGTAGSRKILYYKRSMNCGEVVIGFDVMNNPKKGNELNSKYVKEQKQDLLLLEKTYHRIGNFTFFSRKKSNEDVRDIQHIHKERSENWNETLRYLKCKWGKYQFDGFCTFDEYIKMSLQQFYTKEGWECLKKIVLNDQNKCKKLTNDDKLYEKELKDFYDKIKNCTGEIYLPDYDKDDIKVINAIINIRSKLIIMLLNGKIKP